MMQQRNDTQSKTAALSSRNRSRPRQGPAPWKGAVTLLAWTGVLWQASALVPGCKASTRRGQTGTGIGEKREANNHLRVADRTPGLDALTAQAKDRIQKLATDDMARMVDPDASLRAEATRRLALAQGKWKPDAGDFPPGAGNLETQIRYAKHVLEADHASMRERMALLGRMALALTLRHAGPPKACRATHGPVVSSTAFVDWGHWPAPPRRLAGQLMAPYDHIAEITVRCSRVTWHLTAFHHRDGDRWVLAELDHQTPGLEKWRYEPVPESKVFGTRCLAHPDQLTSKIIEAAKAGHPEGLAHFVPLRLAALFSVLAAAPTEDSARSATVLTDHWPQVAARTRLMTWRDLAGLTATTNWADCKNPQFGAEERHLVAKALASTQKEKRTGAWLLERIASVRSARLHCRNQVLTLTLGKVRQRNCWVLLAWYRAEPATDPGSKHGSVTREFQEH